MKGNFQKKKVIFRTYQIVWHLLGIFEVLLGFRFILKLGAANPFSPFVSFLYSLSGGLIQPFRGIFPITQVEGSVLEWITLFAMLVYAVIAYGIVHLFQLIKPVEPEEVDEVVDNP